MRSIRRSACALAVSVSALAIARPSSGAIVEVTVHDNHGRTLGDVHVGLVPLAPQTGQASGSIYARLLGAVASGVTALDGTVVLSNVPPGTYFVSSGSKDRFLISPSLDRFSAPPVITVRNAGERIPVELVYTRCDLVTLEAWLNDRPGEGLEILFTEQATRSELRVRLRPQGYAETALPPGRWETSILSPPPGFLLHTFEKDRLPQSGASALIEVTDGSNIVRLFWKYAATCHLSGRLKWEGIAGKPNVQIVATLVRAGSWRASAEERGGSSFQRVPVGLDDEGRYEMHLLDGLWRVEAVGPKLLSRSPEFVSLDLAPGDEREADFHVVVEPGTEEAVLFVTVAAPDGHALADASVAVWPFDGSAAGVTATDPLRRARTEGDYRPVATIVGLPKGKYVIAAGHPNYTEGKSDPIDFEARTDVAASKSVTLGAGAVVSAHATDTNRANVTGVDVFVERIGEGPRSLVAEPDLERKRARRGGTTDVSGWAHIGGLDPGRYRVKAELSGPRAQTHVVRIDEGDGSLEESVELTLAESDTKELRIALSPAAGIRAQLGCSDRSPIPRAVAFRILRFPLDPQSPDPPDPDLDRLAILAKQDVTLTGKALDTLTAGPLSAGTFVLAVQPMGHDRWTYEGSVEDVTRAIPVTLDDGTIADGGFVEIDCGPTVRLRPVIGSHDPIPDLREARVDAKLERVAKPAVPPQGEREARKDSPEIRAPMVERAVSRITLRKLPEEKVRLEVTVSHPFFVPETIRVAPAVVTLERGRESEVTVPVPEIGGAMEIAAGESPGALVIDASGNQRRVSAEDGFVRVGGLKAGTYTVRLCAALDCAGATRTWESVEIDLAKVTRVR